MVPGGLTESIWHFIGHFQLIQDIARDRIDYDPSAFSAQPDDYTTKRPEYAVRPDIDDLDVRGIAQPALAPLEDLLHGRILPIKLRSPSQPDPDFDDYPGPPGSPFRPGGGGGGGGGGELHHEVSVVYEPGGEQVELQIKQYNLLSDNDQVFQGQAAAPAIDSNIAQLTVHADAALQEMANDANSAIPTDWWMTQSNEGVVDFLQTHDTAHDTPPANSVEAGYYLNGELQTPTPEPPQPALELHEKPDFGSGVGQWAETGANTSYNAAIIVDLTESAQTMVVMDNYFSTNAIFQTNTLIDHDHVDVAGGGAPAAASTDDNTTDNIADFIEHPGLYATVPAHFGGWGWHVNVVNGDYYSVHTVTQTNLLMDNDVVVQTGSNSHQEVVAGANGQVNLAEVFNGDIHYDLIIVAGSYHGMNVIFQNNILLDNDQIKQLSDDANSSHTVESGNNELTNAATIERFGEDNFVPMSADMMAIVAAIANGASSLDPTLTKILAGPDGVINVLYVNGDYYDVNAIWQTNVTSDVDVMAQLLKPSDHKASANPDDPATQWLSTGDNKLINEAVIVDVAATNTFVNGDAYTDTILVQANLLPTNLDKTVNGDTQALVTELVAFVDDNQNEAPAVHPVMCPPHDDAIANVLH